MATDTNKIVKDTEVKMASAIGYLDDELARIRAGKANPRILDNVRVPYYGSLTPLGSVASINTPDAKTLLITPYEKNLIKEIERAILNSDVGITPENNGEIIRLGIPPLTGERRQSLVKQVKGEAENAKISIRNARRDAFDLLKKSIKEGVSEDVEKGLEEKIQKIHDKFIKQIDELFAAKEKEIMTV
ncbi:MAG: ribosome recycling factor [Tannerella sp.]|jgi:ribosome recycling factor|nr:ribosome recycling factor [Tannerella sp.]